MWLCVLEPGAVYEVKLVAYNGNGESDCSKRLVSLAEEGTSAQNTGEYQYTLWLEQLVTAPLNMCVTIVQ